MILNDFNHFHPSKITFSMSKQEKLSPKKQANERRLLILLHLSRARWIYELQIDYVRTDTLIFELWKTFFKNYDDLRCAVHNKQYSRDIVIYSLIWAINFAEWRSNSYFFHFADIRLFAVTFFTSYCLPVFIRDSIQIHLQTTQRFKYTQNNLK